MVLAVRAKNRTELRVAEAKLPITINGRKTSVWIDSGSPISIFTNIELRRLLGAAGMRMQEVEPQDQELRDYGNNPIKLLGNDEGGASIEWLECLSCDKGNWSSMPTDHRERLDVPLRIAVSTEEAGPGSDVNTGNSRG